MFGRRFCQSNGSLLGPSGDLIDVGREREGHDVRIEPVDDGASLAAGAPMRHSDGDPVVSLAPPFLVEFLVERAVELPGGIIGHVEETVFWAERQGCRSRLRGQSREPASVSAASVERVPISS